MDFVKMQGTGNDFVVVEPEGLELDWPDLSRRMSDRHFGVGADGLLLVLPSQRAAVRMRMFNPDGSESEMCGNGIRCVTKYALERGLVRAEGGVLVETKAGIITVWPVADGGTVEAVRVDMLPPELTPSRIPVAVEGAGPVFDFPISVDGMELKMSFVSMGNPHAIVFLDAPVAEFPLERIGPLAERHPLFPNRTNFEVVNVLSRERIAVRVWERGAGLTMACGTGACAAFVAARLKGLVEERASAELPGGTLTLEWDGEGSVYMTGPVASAFHGKWLG